MSNPSLSRPRRTGVSLGSIYSIWVLWVVAATVLLTGFTFLTPILKMTTEALSYLSFDNTKAVFFLAFVIYSVLSVFTFWLPLLATGSVGRFVSFIVTLLAYTGLAGYTLYVIFSDIASVISAGASITMNPVFIGFPYLTILVLYVISYFVFWPRAKKKKAVLI